MLSRPKVRVEPTHTGGITLKIVWLEGITSQSYTFSREEARDLVKLIEREVAMPRAY
jgi:hypothetical protein